MQRLSGLDGMFLSVDATPTAHGAMAGLMILEPHDDPDAGGREDVIARISERIDAIPPLRWTLVESRVAVNNQYWGESRHVDVPAHVREVEIAAPGTDRELAETVASLQEERLDMTRPPWEYVVLRGLEEGRIAHLLRIHHGVIDGATVPTVLDLLSDEPVTAPDPRDAPGRFRPFLARRPVAFARGLASRALLPVRVAGIQVRTLRHLAGRRTDDGLLLALPSFIGRMLPGWAAPVVNRPLNAVRRRVGRPEVRPMMPKGPMQDTVFNGRITSRRTYAFSDMSLARVKAVGKAYDATLNDAVVAICAGAVRRFMADHGEVPDQPLVVCIPASLRTGEEKERWANHVSMFFAELPTHLEDPAERIRTLHGDLKHAKDNFDAGPTHMVRDVMRFVPQAFWDVSVKLMAHGPDWVPGVPWNVVVSNIRGPAETVNICGREMAGYWPVAFLTPGIGLNITLQSYRDRIDFGFIGCPDLTPDLWSLPDHMAVALAELEQAAGLAVETGKTPAKTARKAPGTTTRKTTSST